MDGAPQGAPEQGAGGGIAEALVALDKQLLQVVSAVQKSGVPDDVKQHFAQALDAYRAGLKGLMGEGGDEPDAPASGTETPEQGGNPNARPMAHGGM